MSSQRGNVSRTRAQRYKNNKAFKNDLHDKSNTIKMINSLSPEGLCLRCKEKIEWKIKYKKYKPLSQPATCIRCQGKTVKRAYYTVCQPCASQLGVCAKCNTKEEIVLQPGPSGHEKSIQDGQLKHELKQLTERQRRSFFRHVEKDGEGSLPTLNVRGARMEDSDSEEDEDDGCDSGEGDDHKEANSS